LVGTPLSDTTMCLTLGKVRARASTQLRLGLTVLGTKHHSSSALEQLAAGSLVVTRSSTITLAATGLLGEFLATAGAPSGAQSLSQLLSNNLALITADREVANHVIAAVGASEELADETRATFVAALIVVTRGGNLITVIM